ncbi:hypothetical protein ACFV3E_36605 [Streptomyces sp. NPDC059718]
MHAPTRAAQPANGSPTPGSPPDIQTSEALSGPGQLCPPCRVAWAGAEADCWNCGMPGQAGQRGSALQHLLAQTRGDEPVGEDQEWKAAAA